MQAPSPADFGDSSYGVLPGHGRKMQLVCVEEGVPDDILWQIHDSPSPYSIFKS